MERGTKAVPAAIVAAEEENGAKPVELAVNCENETAPVKEATRGKQPAEAPAKSLEARSPVELEKGKRKKKCI